VAEGGFGAGAAAAGVAAAAGGAWLDGCPPLQAAAARQTIAVETGTNFLKRCMFGCVGMADPSIRAAPSFSAAAA
jgi:hypothetical protein